MYLKSLTAVGFKSFSERISLVFQPGVTAIVGPNGCGKSNIVDAVRWVLGEQSAKALRGEEMADVIFNGTEKRPKMGFAEVSLTIEGVDEAQLRAAGIELPYREVTITRRVFRDGGSEYFINKTPCRLKDVQQLFMGTGVGRASYSIMAQGNMTQILSSKPEERRMVFEEAAGITRFKAQKREALRKLENTEQNLLRVDDVIREVKRQIISLQRQAGKARRFKQYEAELKHLETQLARHQFDVLRAETCQCEEKLETVRTNLENCGLEVSRVEQQVGGLRQQLSALDSEIVQARQRELELKGECEQHENRIKFNEELLSELATQDARFLTEIAEAEQRRLETEQELGALGERIRESASRLAELRDEMKKRSAVVGDIETALRKCQEELSGAQDREFSAAQQLTRIRNEASALDFQKQANLVRLEKLSAEKIQLEEERLRLEQRLKGFEQESDLHTQNAESQRIELARRQEALKKVQQELQDVSRELESLQRLQAEQHSKLGVLRQLEEGHEGFGAAAQALLKSAPGLLGTLVEHLHVSNEHVPAVEGALGHHLQLILTDEPTRACTILAELAANQTGSASIASLGLRNGAPTEQISAELAQRLGTMGAQPVLDLIHADDLVRPLVASLLGRTYLVPDLDTATRAWSECNGTADFVTRNGEHLSRHGIYSGGHAPREGASPSSVLARKNLIAAIENELAALQEKVEAISRRKGALQSEQTALVAGLQEVQNGLRAQEVAMATRQGELNALQNAMRVLNQKIDTVVFEIQSLATQQREAEDRRTTLTSEIAECEAAEAETRQQLQACQAEVERLRHERDTANAALTEIKVALASQEQVCASLRNQQRPLEQRLGELRDTVAQRQRDRAAAMQRKGRAETEINESRIRLESLAQDRALSARKLADLLAARDRQSAELSAREDNLGAIRRRMSELQEERSKLEVELAQRQMSIRNLLDNIMQRYQVDLNEVRSECITITFADEGPAKVVVLTPEEMQAAGVSTDWDAVAAQIAALRKKMDEMGPVNLVAITEYEEIEQRYQMLAEQRDDLVRARAQLLEAINRVNAQTRTMFVETFERIRENFRNLFVEVFGGGKADLCLVDENDVLESGVEIVACPPGKQLKSISLLSGGEQTMTAVALLFAIYQVRPSPFCILDELDGPLDEANIKRFVHILKRFVQQSQFIIITHNKQTIAMADVLYGITMEERGVSKIVSVKFRKTGELEGNKPTEYLNGTTEAIATEAGDEAGAGTNGEPVALAIAD